MMGMRRKKSELIKSVAELRDADYLKERELGEIYQRLLKGRQQFEEVFENNLKAVMQVSSLDLALRQRKEQMLTISHNVAEAAEVIFHAASESFAVAGQINEQHEELTNTIIQASEETEKVYQRIEMGQQELSNIKELSNQTIEVSKEMQKDMDELLDVINYMNEVIAGINSISSQTNLLALNASIEAARAGEAGRGFAVVADEIRELAEETRKLTGNMGEFVEGIRNASQKSAGSVTSTIEVLDSMTEKIGKIWEINNENQKHVSRVNDSVSSLAAVSEEISSSMTQLETQAANIEGQCDQLKENAGDMREVSKQVHAVTEPIEEVERILDEAAKKMGAMTDDAFFRLEYKEFIKYIESAIAAHQLWLSNLKKMVDECTIQPLQLDVSKCGFGHFYYAMTPKTPEIRPIWDRIEAKHKKFHGYGSDAIKALMAEEYDKAKRIYKDAEQYSGELLSDLEEMKQIAEAIQEKGVSVN